MAKQLHTTNKEMLSGMEEVTRAGYDSETGKKMMESAVMGAKISGQDTETVTQQLIAIKNAFNMSGDEIQRVVDIISRLDNVSATSFAEISEAIKRTAYSAQQAGTPFEKLSAYITTISEKTRKPAEEVGNSLRTIYARYNNIKLGNLDDEGKSINDTEKAMARVGIAIRDGQNKFRDFDAVLTEFMQKFKAGQISQVDYLSSIQALAGTRQRETLMALCENMEALDEHTKQVTESTGAAKNMMQSAYNNSLDAKLNDLSRTFENMYNKILSSDGLKTAVSGLTWVIEKFGNLKTVIAMVTTAFLVMKGTAITGFIADLAAKVVEAGSAFNVLKTAIATNPFGAIALAITGVITAMDLFGDEAENVKNKLQEIDNELSKNKEQLDSLKSLGDQYKELSSKTNLSTEETKRLTEVQNQLVKQFPNMLDYYDAMGNAHIKNADAIKAETDALNKKRAEELSDKMTLLESNSDKLRKDNDKYSNVNHAAELQKAASKYAPDLPYGDVPVKQLEEFNSKIRENNKQLSDNAQKIKEANSDYSLLNQSLKAMADNSLKGVTDEWIKGTKTNQEYRDAIDKTSKALNSSSVQDALNKY